MNIIPIREYFFEVFMQFYNNADPPPYWSKTTL